MTGFHGWRSRAAGAMGARRACAMVVSALSGCGLILDWDDGGTLIRPQLSEQTSAAAAVFDHYRFSSGRTSYEVAAAEGLLVNDAEGARLAPAQVISDRGARVVIGSGGGFSYEPPPGAFWGDDRFSYRLQRGDTARVRLTLQPRVVEVADLVAGEGYGFAVAGTSTGQAAAQALAMSDFDGDGKTDVFVSALARAPGTQGALHGIWGGARREPIPLGLPAFQQKNQAFTLKGVTPGDEFGRAIAAVGDVNGDGLGDLAIGAPGSPLGEQRAGAVYVVFGAPRRSVPFELQELHGESTHGFTIAGDRANLQAGFSVSAAGDVNGDGLDDIVVGSRDTSSLRASGSAYVVLGKANGRPVRLSDLRGDNAVGFAVVGGPADGLLGSSVGGGGDFNGDGYADVVLGAAGAGEGGHGYIIFGAENPTSPVDLSEISATGRGVMLVGTPDEGNAGWAVAHVGEVNGDEFDDIAISATNADPDSRGTVYVVLGHPNPVDVELETVRQGNGGFAILGAQPGDIAGLSLAGAGDFNGDGLDDVVLGAYGSTPLGFQQAGAVHIVFGKVFEKQGAQPVQLATLPERPSAGVTVVGAAEGDSIGFSVAGGGDVNGDGLADVVVGAPGVGEGGEAYTLFGWDATDSLGARDGARAGGPAAESFLHEAPGRAHLAGGRGGALDKVVLSRATRSLDLGALPALQLNSIEAIDIGSAGPHTLTLGNRAIRRLPGKHAGSHPELVRSLQVLGDEQDTLRFDLSSFEELGTNEGRRVFRRIGAAYGIEVSPGLKLEEPTGPGGCTPPLLSCGGQCVRATSPEACGPQCERCPGAPNGRAACDGLRCGVRCAGGFHECAGACRADASPESCGASCTPCPVPHGGEATCTDGVCGFACTEGFHACGLRCVADDSTEGCGFECAPCGRAPGVVAECDGTTCRTRCDEAGGAVCTGAVVAVPDSYVVGAGQQRVEVRDRLLSHNDVGVGTVAGETVATRAGGQVEIRPDGSFAYEPPHGGSFWGDDEFWYTGLGESGESRTWVRLTVNPSVVRLAELRAGRGQGVALAGVRVDDVSGHSVSSAGDVNGDGLDDLLIGVPNGGRGAGIAYVAFGRPDLRSTRMEDIEAGVGGFVISLAQASGRDGWLIGWSVASAGDVNGDGLDDVLVGAPGADRLTMLDPGAAYVVYGKPDTAPVDLARLGESGDAGFQILGMAGNDRVGVEVAAAGDFNGDGFDDVVLGAPFNSAGIAYVIFGQSARSEPVWLYDIERFESPRYSIDGPGFAIFGASLGDGTGFSLEGAGDVNGDGLDDLIVGAPAADPKRVAGAGVAYLIFGKRDRLPISLTQVERGAPEQGVVLEGAAIGDRAGWSVSGAGDINGDGFADLLIGAPFAETAAEDAGRVYVVLGSPQPASLALSRLLADSNLGFVIDGIRADGRLGGEVAGAGDADGDGLDDLLIGDAILAGPERAFRAYLLFGRAVARRRIQLAEIAAGLGRPQGVWLEEAAPGDYTGHSLSGRGDFDGDGLDDLLVGAPVAGSSGLAYVVPGWNAAGVLGGRRGVLAGGARDDVLEHDGSDLVRISGGHGRDTLALLKPGFQFDATRFAPRVREVEVIDLLGSLGATLVLNDAAVRTLPEAQTGAPFGLLRTLTVLGAADDTLRLKGSPHYERLGEQAGLVFWAKQGASYGLAVSRTLALVQE